VTPDGSFLVEDFIDAITSQLDRVQDALRVKAVNRPLTYALKDLAQELKVSVMVDPDGRVRFRASGPHEVGASVVHLSFTTITKPMIEENTVSLAASRAPTLEEAGFAPDERRRLERVGVHNVAQLQRLGASAGMQAAARLSALPVDRLKRALSLGRPTVNAIRPLPAPPLPHDAQPAPAPRPAAPLLRVPAGSRRLLVAGRQLAGEDGTAAVRLNNRPLTVAEADDERIVVELPEACEGGAFELELPGGHVLAYELTIDDGDERTAAPGADDRWAPSGNGR
jgi:hypothetical protein